MQYASPLSFEDNFRFVCRDESFIPYIDGLPAMKRNIGGPFMMPIVDKFADMGTILIGKVESGECKKGKPSHFLFHRGSRKLNVSVWLSFLDLDASDVVLVKMSSFDCITN